MALRINRPAFQRLVGAALPGQRTITGLHHPRSNGSGRFAGPRVDQRVGRQRANFDMQINAVQQRPAELALVPL